MCVFEYMVLIEKNQKVKYLLKNLLQFSPELRFNAQDSDHVNGRKLCVGETSALSTYPPARWEGGVAIGSVTEAVAWRRSVWRSRAGLRVLFRAEHKTAEGVAVSQQNHSLDQLS